MPTIHPTDREQRTAWRWRAELLVRRGAAFVLDPADDAKRLTYNHVTIGQRLLDFAVGTGRAFPSHATLAKRTGLSVGTVGTALAMLAAAGLLAWVQTWVPNPAGFHGAKRQGPNLYSFLLPGDSGAPAYDHKRPGVENPSPQSSFLRPVLQAQQHQQVTPTIDAVEARAALDAIAEFFQRHGMLLQLVEKAFGQAGGLGKQATLPRVLIVNEHGGLDDVLLHQTDTLAGDDVKRQAAPTDSFSLIAHVADCLAPAVIPIFPNQCRRLRPSSTSGFPVRKASDCR